MYFVKAVENLLNYVQLSIHQAARDGNVEVIQLLLKQESGNIDMVDNDGVTPLCIAAYDGHVGVVKLLLESGANVNLMCNDGNPLFVACQNGHSEVVKLLLEKCADVELECCESNSLFIAAQQGHADVVKELLNGGANVNFARKDGFTSLSIASQVGHLDVVKVLLDGANAHLDLITPLLAASHWGRAEVVKLLLQHGKVRCPLFSLLFFFLFVFYLDTNLVSKGATLDVKTCMNALSGAVRRNRLDVAEVLIQLCPQVRNTNTQHTTHNKQNSPI